jgi:DNA transposition AAA+ family ATPase
MSKLGQNEVNKVIESLDDYLERTGETRTSIAKAIGVSGATLSLFMKGEYKAPHTVVPKIVAFLELQEKKEIAPEKPGFKMTTVSSTAMDVITYCHIGGVMGTVYGDAGIGKTAGAIAYCRENPDSVMVTMSPVFANIKGVSELLCDQLKIADKRTNIDAYRGIVRKLSGSGRVVIIDEAQHLTNKTLEHLRAMIVDDAKCGLVLIGNEVIYNRMTGKQESQLAQLFSRIAIRKNLLTTNVKRKDIDMLFDKLGDEEKNFLYQVSHSSKWGIRGAINLYMNAAGNGDLSVGGLASMAKFMGIGVN